jgi:hypothetical protein
LREFARIAAVCALGLGAIGWSASLASAQQVDVMAGGGTLFSSSQVTATQDQPALAEKGSPYPSVGADIILYRRYGLNFEGAWKWKQGVYPGYDQNYRPILMDVNALFQPRLSKKFGADLMVGVGAESVRFDPASSGNCDYASCSNFISNTHFMEHLGGGVRYYFYHRLFVRPEVHYYHIQNNLEFYSNNIVRAGATVGYTFGKR